MRGMREGQGAPAMIPSFDFLLFQGVPTPDPEQPWLWIAFVAVLGIGAMWIDRRKLDDARHAEKDAAIKRAHDREDRLLEVDAARTETMRQLVAASEKSATLTQTVVDGSLALRQGIETNAKSIGDSTTAMEALTLEFRNMALRVQEAEAARRATDKSP